MIIKFEILPNNSYHKDFLVKINHQEFLCDTYYFWEERFGNLTDPYEGIIAKIAQYFDKWTFEIKNLNISDRIFIPIDFSDEYIGGFKIKLKMESLLSVSFGYITDINDIVIRIQDDGRISTNLTYKNIESVYDFEIDKQVFLNSLAIGYANNASA